MGRVWNVSRASGAFWSIPDHPPTHYIALSCTFRSFHAGVNPHPTQLHDRLAICTDSDVTISKCNWTKWNTHVKWSVYSSTNQPRTILFHCYCVAKTCFMCYRVLWSPQIRVLVVTTLVARNCSGKAKLTIEDSKVEKCSTSKNTKTEIINTFPKWFEGGLLTPGKSSMCATLARRTVTPTANLRERGEGGAVHCGALCSVYCLG